MISLDVSALSMEKTTLIAMHMQQIILFFKVPI